jgi:hypothetical protein
MDRAELAAAHGGSAVMESSPGQNREREREKKQARVLHYLGVELLEGLKSTGTRRNGSVTENSELWLNNGSAS